MRYKNKGFTIIEILTVLAIMAILIGALLPALNTARNAARQAKQRVQFISIEQALLAWRNDFGEYPESDAKPVLSGTYIYCGAQKLAEALLGLDLRGYCPNPSSPFNADLAFYQSEPPGRKPRYLELETANAFYLGDQPNGLFTTAERTRTNPPLLPYGYVLCDVFWKRTVNIGSKSVKAGMPILYYRANPSGSGLTTQLRQLNSSIYRFTDNYDLANIPPNAWSRESFVSFITDPKVIRPQGALHWPYKPDSYILISAGIDGLYGTTDDITNFGY